jgi:hypothetical protein
MARPGAGEARQVTERKVGLRRFGARIFAVRPHHGLIDKTQYTGLVTVISPPFGVTLMAHQLPARSRGCRALGEEDVSIIHHGSCTERRRLTNPVARLRGKTAEITFGSGTAGHSSSPTRHHRPCRTSRDIAADKSSNYDPPQHEVRLPQPVARIP